MRRIGSRRASALDQMKGITMPVITTTAQKPIQFMISVGTENLWHDKADEKDTVLTLLMRGAMFCDLG